MDATAMDVLMEYVGWRSSTVASRFVEVAESAAASRRTKRSRATAFIRGRRLVTAVEGVLWNGTHLSQGTASGRTPKRDRLEV